MRTLEDVRRGGLCRCGRPILHYQSSLIIFFKKIISFPWNYYLISLKLSKLFPVTCLLSTRLKRNRLQGGVTSNADVHRRGGGQTMDVCDIWEGGSKISKTLRTSFVNGPLNNDPIYLAWLNCFSLYVDFYDVFFSITQGSSTYEVNLPYKRSVPWRLHHLVSWTVGSAKWN